MKRKFGIEYARGGKFPNMENRYDDVPDIPDTLKNFDSFKFDRSMEKAENYENGKVFKRFEDRSTTDPESKLTGYFTSRSTKKMIIIPVEFLYNSETFLLNFIQIEKVATAIA